MNGVQTRFKCKLDVKRCKRFVFPPSSLLPRSNALKTKAIRYFQTDRTLTRIVSPPLNEYHGPDFEETLGGQQLGCYPILKLIRKRAGIEPGADGMYGLEKNMTQKQMRQAIQEERRLEFAFEGHRFFDVRRWMIAPQTESKTMHGIEITRATDGTKTWKEFDVRTHVWRPAMYFFPIPYNETVKSKDLLQNPYYN